MLILCEFRRKNKQCRIGYCSEENEPWSVYINSNRYKFQRLNTALAFVAGRKIIRYVDILDQSLQIWSYMLREVGNPSGRNTF